MDRELITLEHGAGGARSKDLLDGIIIPGLGLGNYPMSDGAEIGNIENAVVATDSFTVSPLFFRGGDIGHLSICGTANDLASMGAKPLFFSLSFIIEEGFLLKDFQQILESLGNTAKENNIRIVTGDTKVVEKGKCDRLFINTCGIGSKIINHSLKPENIQTGDSIILTGTIGDHGATILNARENFAPDAKFESDAAVLWDMVSAIIEKHGSDIRIMRDPTRGGLAAALNEIASNSGFEFMIKDSAIPVDKNVGDFLNILGLDPLGLANEGKMIIFVDKNKTNDIIEILNKNKYGKAATVIGTVADQKDNGRVVLETEYGTRRILPMPIDEGLPRIC